jgi:DNA repair exonuclease SbcCD ATPase subunit
MKPAERKGLIDELTGIEEMSVIEKAARQRSKAAEGERMRLQTELDRLNAAAGEVQNLEHELAEKSEELKKLKASLDDVQGELKTADELLTTVQASHAQKTRLEGEARQAEILFVKAEQVLEQLKNKKRQYAEQLEQLENGTTCPTCGTALDLSHPHVSSKIDEYTKLYKDQQKYIEAQEKDVSEKKDAKVTADNLAKKADSQITQQYEQAKRLKDGGKLKLDTLSARHSVVSAEHAKLAGQLEVLKRDLPKIPQIEADLAEQKKRIKGFDLIAEAFSKRGIPRELTRSFVNEIEKGSNALLIGLSPFTVRLSLEKSGVQKAGITEGTMDVWVKDNLPERKVEMLSGGEKMRVMLAVRLATAQAMAKKHERAIKTLIIDEALDGLDTAGKDAALTMITSLTSFERVLMITHDPSVAGYFPERIYFTKAPDGSSMVI